MPILPRRRGSRRAYRRNRLRVRKGHNVEQGQLPPHEYYDDQRRLRFSDYFTILAYASIDERHVAIITGPLMSQTSRHRLVVASAASIYIVTSLQEF